MFVPLRPTEDAAYILSRLEDSQRDELVKNCVHAILVLGQERTPIKKLDLNRLAFPTSNYRVAGAVVQKANSDLNRIFGMRLYESEDKTKYLLVNSTTEFAKFIIHSDSKCEELAVLYFILMGIFVSPDERICWEDIESSLKPMDIPLETLKSHLDSLIKILYLNQDKRQETRFYSWGPRAFAEIDPEKFFSRFLDLTGEKSDKDWPDLRKRIDKLKSIPNRKIE